MIHIYTNQTGVVDVRILADSKETERKELISWPTIQPFVTMMDAALRADFSNSEEKKSEDKLRPPDSEISEIVL